MFEIGRPLQLHYPICTRVNCRLEFRPRQLTVRRIRDLVVEPLSPIEYGRRPLLLRGRYLIEAVLPDGSRRRFYPSSSLEYFRPAPLRIGIYHQLLAGRPISIYPTQYGQSVRDRILLMRHVRSMIARDPELRLGILADDLNLVMPDGHGGKAASSLRKVG